MMYFNQQGIPRASLPIFTRKCGTVLFSNFTGLVAALALLQSVVAAEYAIERGVASAKHLPLDQAGLTCGRDCLYVWLRLQGVRVSYGEIESHVFVGPQGSELSEIAKASREWQPSSRLGKLDYRALCALSGPAIVHVWVTQGKNRQGHYMVITDATEKEVSLIETATQIRTKMTPQEFSSMWSGYALFQDNPILNWEIMALSFLPISVLFFIGSNLKKWYSRAKKASWSTEAAAILASVLFFMPGCGSSPLAVAERSESIRKVESIPIAASKRHVDLGIVPFSKPGTARFLITNLKNDPIQLQLGQPSCGCTKAILSNDTVSAKGTVTLEISLGAEGGLYAGRREGSVELGIKGDSQSLRFSVEGTLEGVMLFPYTLRLSKEVTSESPGPLEGEITLGMARSSEKVTIDEVTMPAREESGLVIGQAVVKPGVEVNGYFRRGFAIPISVRPGLRPKPGVYIVRITGTIGVQTFDVTGSVYIVPTMEE